MTPIQRRVISLGIIVLGLGIITVAELFLRDNLDTPAFSAGQVRHDRAGHTARELLVAAIGVGLAIAGGVILVSGEEKA